jgi:hypothetical protein
MRANYIRPANFFVLNKAVPAKPGGEVKRRTGKTLTEMSQLRLKMYCDS